MEGGHPTNKYWSKEPLSEGDWSKEPLSEGDWSKRQQKRFFFCVFLFSLCVPLKLGFFAQGRCLSLFACSIFQKMLIGNIEQLQSSGAHQKILIHFNSPGLWNH